MSREEGRSTNSRFKSTTICGGGGGEGKAKQTYFCYIVYVGNLFPEKQGQLKIAAIFLPFFSNLRNFRGGRIFITTDNYSLRIQRSVYNRFLFFCLFLREANKKENVFNIVF